MTKETENNLIEEWRDIAGYEGLYQVSNLGNVKSLPRNIFGRYNSIYKERILKPSKSKGYRSVTLCKDGVHKTLKVHRLVAVAFIPNKANLEQVNHIDGNKANNKVENLEWCTASYNNFHKFNVLGYTYTAETREKFSKTHLGVKWSDEKKQNLSKVLKGKKKLGLNKKVICITTGEIFNSIQEAAQAKNVKPSNISMCLAGKIKFTKKLSWKFLGGEDGNK